MHSRQLPKAQYSRALPQFVDASACPIYILNVSKEVASHAGIPKCSIDDPTVWPHSQEMRGVMSMHSTPHYVYQHGAQYWLNQALRNASNLLTTNISRACLVWLDFYCYNQWYHSYLYPAPQPRENPGPFIDKALQYIVSTPRFKKRQGRDYVLHISHPAIFSQYSKHLCEEMLHSYTLVSELGMMCGNNPGKLDRREAQLLPYNSVADIDLSAPVVGSERPVYVYHRSGCSNSTDRSSGMLLRHYVVEALEDLAPDIEVACTCSVCPGAQLHAEVQQKMRQSLFCLVLAGDTASSLRLTEVILAGCIPVFLGPPWHTMPLNFGDVDYASFSVFLNVTDTSKWVLEAGSNSWGNTIECVRTMRQTADVAAATVTVPDLVAAYRYLRRMPKDEITMRQEALQRERAKFYYGTPPESSFSELATIVIKHMLRYGRNVSKTLEQV